jgi:TRAP transporter TAXI family solute receptor
MVALGVATILVATAAVRLAWQAFSVKHVTIAAGSSKQEGFVMMQALKNVVERRYPRLRLTLQETLDNKDTVSRLERDDAQLAVTQSDTDAGSSARMVAVLFEDTFQVLANPGTGIARFIDLKGKRVALATRGAQFQTFLFVAQYYGLTSADFVFVGEDDENADLAFANKTADAVFRVRALHDPGIERLVSNADVVFVPIDEAAGIHVHVPSYSPTVIPKGTYLGDPPLPAADIPTVALRHTLLARQDLDEDVVWAITEVLMDHRPEMAAVFPQQRPELLPLLGEVRQPTEAMGLGLGLHRGAQEQYQRNSIPFVRAHADLVGAIAAAFGLVGLWMWAIRLSLRRHQRARLGRHLEHLHDLMEETEISTTERQSQPIRTELLRVMRVAIKDVEQGRMSALNLRSFAVVWRMAFSGARARRAAIRKFSGTARPAEPPAAPSSWSFAKLLLSKLR